MEFAMILSKEQIDSPTLAKAIGEDIQLQQIPILLEKNENSDLAAKSAPIMQEFFEKVFDGSGPYWKLYSELGFAAIPANMKYAIFLNGQLYFIKNVEYIYLNNIGPEKSIGMNESKLTIKKKITLANLILSLAAPFDALKQVRRRIELGFFANEHIQDFEEFRNKAMEFCQYYSLGDNITDPIKTSKESFNLALESLVYSNLALLCFNLKIKLKESKSISVCEAETLHELVNEGDFESIKKTFGFYSLDPYDVTKKRFRDGTEELSKFGFPEPPKEYVLKWRENSKYLCARFLDVLRISLEKLGEKIGLKDLVFHLTIQELENLAPEKQRELAKNRKEKLKFYDVLPSRMIFFLGKFYQQSENLEPEDRIIHKGLSVSSKSVVSGPAISINSLEDFQKFKEGSIIISRTLSPNLSILFRKARGAVSESGGSLAHAALIARELNVPCVVQVQGISKVKDGEIVQIDGRTGDIEILEKSAHLFVQEPPLKTIIKQQANNIQSLPKALKSEKMILPLDEPNFESYGVGSKAANLSLLSRSFDVPGAVCIPSYTFEEIAVNLELGKIATRLRDLTSKDLPKIETISKKIKREIINYNFTSGFLVELKSNIVKLKAQSFAVRSSAISEDSVAASFAGQLDSYLNVNNLEEIKASIKKCWASYYNTRAIIYRIEKNMIEEEPRMSVILQQMISPIFSGVMFTKSPDDVASIRIEAVKGSGEKLVSGKVVPNFYSFDRNSFFLNSTKEYSEIDKNLVRKIAETGKRIEELFGQPQDIEWALDKDSKLWILQSRPITVQI